MKQSHIRGLYKLSLADRILALQEAGWLTKNQATRLHRGGFVLSAAAADKMIENAVGVFALPLAIAPNFIVNGREHLAPLVVEEPSIVAALSSAAALARESGGFFTTADESLLAGQIHITQVANADASLNALMAARSEILALADRVHPRLQARGGGVRDMELRCLQLGDGSPLLAVHLLVDTCDAMGANLVNSICEAVAPRIEELCDGKVALRILSNLADRSVVTAQVQYSTEQLRTAQMSGEDVRDGIVLANEIALADPYRAATHNKGIMNGIDAAAVATGNDWRAIEAGAHAYAARAGHYSALTRWTVTGAGDLAGELTLPLKSATVGGTLSSNPAAELAIAIAGVKGAGELNALLAAVGLAQNFAALRALASDGIQAGHMRLHARSLAASAGATEKQIDSVVARLVASGDVKLWKAQELLANMSSAAAGETAATATAAGKVILFGEHAVVYGRQGLAVPLCDAVTAAVSDSDKETTITVDSWGLHTKVDPASRDGIDGLFNLVRDQLGIGDCNYRVHIDTVLPRGAGLGSSAAIAVAITRALAKAAKLKVDDNRVNKIAYACEEITHGRPSGIDNTLSCYAQPMLFRRGDGLQFTELKISSTLPLVIAFSDQIGETHEQVAAVAARRSQHSQHFDALFDQMEHLAEQGATALVNEEYQRLGALMNVCHGLLNAIGVSTPHLEQLVSIARDNGAVGAKLTGAGGGGAVVAVCPGTQQQVADAFNREGVQTLIAEVQGKS